MFRYIELNFEQTGMQLSLFASKGQAKFGTIYG